MDDFGTNQPTQEQLHKMRYYIQSSSTRSSESSLSEFDENKNNTPTAKQDQSLMLRNMALINQNINKKNEKKRKDKRTKLRVNESDDRKMEEQTSVYSASILSANCLSNATQMLQEVTGFTSDVESRRPPHGQSQSKGEMSQLMTNLFKLDRTLNLLSQELKKVRNDST